MNIKLIKEALLELIMMNNPALKSKGLLLDVYGLIERNLIDEVSMVKIHETLNKAIQKELPTYLKKEPNGLITIPILLKIIGELSGLEVIW
jgi:hypothetical protein